MAEIIAMHSILIYINFFAQFGRNFPRELPTRLQAACPKPNGNTKPINKMFLNIIYKTCTYVLILPAITTKD